LFVYLITLVFLTLLSLIFLGLLSSSPPSHLLSWVLLPHTFPYIAVLTVNVTDPNQRVSIYKCDGATIDIHGKCKAVTLDGCEKTACLFDTVVSCVETVNCKRLQLQAREMCPVVSIEKTDGCLVYLSKETAETTNFVTSKSSEMNVNWPDENDDMVEAVIPEQFQHRLDLKTNKVNSDISDLYSH